jgi:peptide/nickel transport system permease protein
MGNRRRIRWALALLIAIHALALGAGLVAPYGYDDQHRDYPYAAPMKLHFQGGRLLVYGLDPQGDTYREDPSRQYPVRFFVHGRILGVDAPGVFFALGSDGYGRDVLSRLLYGARISLATGLLAAALALAIGWSLGTVAGFYGGWADEILMRISEFFLALPWFYLLLAVRAFLPLRIEPAEAFLLLVGIIGGVGWVRPARLVRGVVLSARERPFVLAARGFGAGPRYLIRRHILPLTAGVTITQATVLIPQYILAEVGLSFLGLGVGEPAPSWGNMLAEARQYHALVLHPWLLAPGLAAIPVLLAYFLLADTLALSTYSRSFPGRIAG